MFIHSEGKIMAEKKGLFDKLFGKKEQEEAAEPRAHGRDREQGDVGQFRSGARRGDSRTPAVGHRRRGKEQDRDQPHGA